MEIDSILHVVVGGIITIFLFAIEVPGLLVLISLFVLAGSKEIFDHFSANGHISPDCMNEHMSDFCFSFLFFFIFLPILSFAIKDVNRKIRQATEYIIIFFLLTSFHLSFNFFNNTLKAEDKRETSKIINHLHQNLNSNN